MNRREAIAALMSLPQVARISVASLKPDDVIVLECSGHLSMDAALQIRSVIEQVWPGRKAVVLENGMTLKVVSS